MRSIKWAIALFLTSALAMAGATRILDGAQITNGAATITLPTATSTLLTTTMSNIGEFTSNIVPDGDANRSIGSAAKNIDTFHGNSFISNDDMSIEGPGGTTLFFEGQAEVNFTSVGQVQFAGVTVLGLAISPTLSGTRASPTAVTAAGGVVFSGGVFNNVYFLEGDSGPIDITAVPQISIGSTVGQALTIIGRNNTNTLTLEHGTGLSLNGTIVLAEDSIIDLIWDGTNWTEKSRR